MMAVSVYEAAIAVAALQVLVFAYAFVRARWWDSGRVGGQVGEQTESGTTVACPYCGAENERGYTFCRRCIRELPGASRTMNGPTPPLGRRSP